LDEIVGLRENLFARIPESIVITPVAGSKLEEFPGGKKGDGKGAAIERLHALMVIGKGSMPGESRYSATEPRRTDSHLDMFEALRKETDSKTFALMDIVRVEFQTLTQKD
jgi:hypothetical protein